MENMRIVLSLVAVLGFPSGAFACKGFFDPDCDLKHGGLPYTGKTIGKGAPDTGALDTIIRAPDTGELDTIIDGGAPDTGKTIEKGFPYTGYTTHNLTPVREYLRAKDIPPPEAGAYGVVVFQSKRTPANQTKLTMVCSSFVAFFPRSETAIVPVSDQMITIWPLDEPDAEKDKEDDCDFVLKHYDLNASEAAINDARNQHAAFDGEGPYLVGWSPSNTRGVPDKLVLVIDMSADNSQQLIDQKFLFWKNSIVKNPALWRNGWSLDGVRVSLKEFADQYGDSILKAVKLVSAKVP